MESMKGFVLVAVMFGGCTKPNPAASCKDGKCSDPGFPYCDQDGSIDGQPNTCISVNCTPGDVGACHGDGALVCNATGDGYDMQSCSAGCVAMPKPHCLYLQPRFLPDVCDTRATMDLQISNSGTFDPNSNASCTDVMPQPGAPSICVAHYRSISIAPAAVLTVAGVSTTLGRPLALVADADLTLDGTLDVSAHGNTNGPGGGVIESGGPVIPRDGGGNNGNGGGGAGGASAGGAGGSVGMNGGAANGGAAIDPATTPTLLGGASTGRGTFMSMSGGPLIGGGGGAATLVSCRGRVIVTGTISAGGGGGLGGFLSGVNPFGGVGGGAGGYVTFQGLGVEITGQLFANGGAGGSGLTSQDATGNPGGDGPNSDVVGAAGGQQRFDEGPGGEGGFVTTTPNPGQHPNSGNGATPGGGGGSVGYFQSYTPDGAVPILAPQHASPALQPNATATTR
jgi:hypothetical protein